MESVDMHKILHPLVDAWESEVVEFKEASKDYKTPEIYRYCSIPSIIAKIRVISCTYTKYTIRFCNSTSAVITTHISIVFISFKFIASK